MNASNNGDLPSGDKKRKLEDCTGKNIDFNNDDVLSILSNPSNNNCDDIVVSSLQTLSANIDEIMNLLKVGDKGSNNSKKPKRKITLNEVGDILHRIIYILRINGFTIPDVNFGVVGNNDV